MVEASPPVDFGVSPVGRVLVVEDDPSPTAWCRPVYGPAALRDRLRRHHVGLLSVCSSDPPCYAT
jgi:hypothetical protein